MLFIVSSIGLTESRGNYWHAVILNQSQVCPSVAGADEWKVVTEGLVG